MDVKELYRLRTLLYQEFDKQMQLAKDEDDLDYLAEVAVEILTALPSRIILTDFYSRADVKNNMTENTCNDTKIIDQLMQELEINFDYDATNDYITTKCEEDFEKGGEIDIAEI